MKKKVLAFILSAFMLLTVLPVMALTGAVKDGSEDNFTVVVSIEGLTLGQGIYVKPKTYTLDEINELIAQDGYEACTEENLTAGMATLAFLNDNGLEYEITGNWENSAYIAAVKGLDTHEYNIPEVITQNGGPSNEDAYAENNDEWLGEFDFDFMAGWMITVNDYMLSVGSSAWTFEGHDSDAPESYYDLGNTYVVRWQFTLHGYGADLGVSTGWGNSAYFDGANKAPLYAAYARSTDEAKKAEALKVMENLTASQTEVDAALAQLTSGGTVSPTPTTAPTPVVTASPEPTATPEPGNPGQDVNEDYAQILSETLDQLPISIPAPVFGTTGGEWTVLALARGEKFGTGSQYFEDYYERIVKTVQETSASVNMNGALHKYKSTENARLILALTAIGKDPTNVGGIDIVGAYVKNGMDWVKRQGINGPVFALIALDSRDYAPDAEELREQCIEYILDKEIAGGGWALSGSNPDPDMTAMVLQALVNYRDNSEVAAAAKRGFDKLSEIQRDNGGFASWGSVNSESIAQVIVACTAWGIDPQNDERFVKDASAVDALLGFYVEDARAFAHVIESGGGYVGGEDNAMATDQAAYALVAYDRYVNEKNSLYDMSDVGASAIDPDAALAASLALPVSIENRAGTAFNAVVNLNRFEEGYKLFDCIVTIPDGVTVTGVTMGSRIGCGQVVYNFEESTGKLRIVYFDAEGGAPITCAGAQTPVELLTIGLELENVLAGGSVNVAISGMTFKISSDSSSQTVVDTTNASDSAELVNGLSFSVMTLYTGDGVDLIPENKVALVIAVTGVNDGVMITFSDGEYTYDLKYNKAITEKTGVVSYVIMADVSIPLQSFVNADNYTVSSGSADELMFGDINSDGLINAQDALNAVNMWLRKGDAPSDNALLAANVTGDSRVNTFDALGIVEFFVDGSEFAVINRAATLNSPFAK